MTPRRLITLYIHDTIRKKKRTRTTQKNDPGSNFACANSGLRNGCCWSQRINHAKRNKTAFVHIINGAEYDSLPNINHLNSVNDSDVSSESLLASYSIFPYSFPAILFRLTQLASKLNSVMETKMVHR